MENMLSQEEINALLEGMNPDNLDSSEDEKILSDEEIDVIGEVSNISMGSASTALSSLLNSRVNITTPNVNYSTWDELSSQYDKPCVFIQIYYKSGLDGSNILMIKEEDVKYIADLMMGGDGSNIEGELTDLHLSAISEAMNQMMGSAATSLSTLLNTPVNITPPTAILIDLNESVEDVDIADFLKGQFVNVAFNMTIGDKVDTSLMQLYPFEFAHDLYNKFMASYDESDNELPQEASKKDQTSESIQSQASQEESSIQKEQSIQEASVSQEPIVNRQVYEEKEVDNYSAYEDVSVQKASFEPFTNTKTSNTGAENINIISEVPLEVRVELGRTHRTIKDILEFAPGTIIELDRLSGEPVDVLINDKAVAKGEVVVIDESFGIRITEILNN